MWFSGFEQCEELRLVTIGRNTGRRHEVIVNFVADDCLFITTSDNRRDWVQNLLKNPSCQLIVSGTARDVYAVVASADKREKVRQLYDEKYEGMRRLRPYVPHIPTSTSIIFELKPM